MIGFCVGLFLISYGQPDTLAPALPDPGSARESASVLVSDGFEKSGFDLSWNRELWTPTAGLFSSQNPRAGKQALRLSWSPKQVDGSNASLHAELLTRPLPPGQTERWYGYSARMPADAMASDTQPVIVSQWHGTPDPGFSDTVPPVAIYLNPDNHLTLVYRASSKPILTLLQHPTSQKFIDLGLASFDGWVDYVVHVKWDPSGGQGVLQVWQDGVLLVNEQGVNLGYPQQQKPYWKLGLYAWTGQSSHAERVIYYDEVRIGDSASGYDAVKPGRGAGTAKAQRP